MHATKQQVSNVETCMQGSKDFIISQRSKHTTIHAMFISNEYHFSNAV